MSPTKIVRPPPSMTALQPAPFLPMARSQMQSLGWDQCDVILITGDAYIDHPSFGMALIGRLIESRGYRVGIISQPNWHSIDDFLILGLPRLYFGITAGNMDSMVNRYTSERKRRSDDAYSEGGAPDRRPDRAVTVYAQRCREAMQSLNAGTIPIIIGSIEASLRRIAHYDYWSDKVKHSVLLDSKADLLIFGNAERALINITDRLHAGESLPAITDVRGTAFVRSIEAIEKAPYQIIDHTQWEQSPQKNPPTLARVALPSSKHRPTHDQPMIPAIQTVGLATPPPSGEIFPSGLALVDTNQKEAVRLPSFEQVSASAHSYAHASRVFHLESNPGNARPLIQRDGKREVWLNPPPIPLSTAEIDAVYDLPYTRAPHPRYGDQNDPRHKIPAWEMIRHSVNIMRGCFGGCTFCSITEHEGRIIQSRSESSIVREIEAIRDKTPSFTGVISDLGGPTANMWRLNCKDPQIEKSCRRLSCVYPDICKNLQTDHTPLINLYRRARAIDGVKKILIGSGVRYDLAVRSPDYVRELAQHHVGGYLKIAPEHTEEGVLSKMMKPKIDRYDRFRQLFERYSRQASKEQYLIPYFIAAHPGSTTKDMMRLSLWLKKNQFRPDQVQAFLPTPMALATTMYHAQINPLKPLRTQLERVATVRGERERRLQKAFLRYHDPNNGAMLRAALREMGRKDLIGNHKGALVSAETASSNFQSNKKRMKKDPRLIKNSRR